MTTASVPTAPTGDPQLVAEIERALAACPERVFPISWAGAQVWVKRAVVTKRVKWHLVQRAFAALMPFELLRPTYDELAGGAALRREASIIGALRRKGARVPEVLARSEDWIALSDVGTALDKQIYAAPDATAACALALAGVDALLQLHAAGAWHGNTQSRNLAGPPDRIGFIDFEEDVRARLSLDGCHTRDLLLYLFSLATAEKRHAGIMNAVATRMVEGTSPRVRKRLFRVWAACFLPMAALRPFGKWLGWDVRKALLLGTALHTARKTWRARAAQTAA